MSADQQALHTGLAEQLRTQIGTAIGAEVSAAPAVMDGNVWYVSIGGPAGPLATMAFDEAGVAALASALGRAGAPADAGETVRSLAVRAAAPLGGPGAAPEAISVQRGVWDRSQTGLVQGLSSPSLPVPVRIAILAAGVVAASPDAARMEPQAPEPSAQERLDVLLDIDLPLVVRFGCTDMPLKSLARLGPGSLIDLGRSPEDPVEVLVGNRIVARGEVVVVSGSYGIRILDIVSQRERVHGLGV